MRKLATTALALLWLVAGCTTRPAASPTEVPPTQTAAEPEQPVAQASTSTSPMPNQPKAPETADSIFPFQLASLTEFSFRFLMLKPTGGISPADEGDRMRARQELLPKLAAGSQQPAPGLAEQLLAYFALPSVAASPAPEHGFSGAARLDLGRFQSGTRVIVVNGTTAGGSPTPWQIGLLQWQEGGKVSTALIPGLYPRTYTILTDGAQPVLLAEGIPAPGAPLTFSAYTFPDGRFTPVPLAVGSPTEANSVTATATASGEVELKFPGPANQLIYDPNWVCHSTACAKLTWKNEALTLQPLDWSIGAAGARQKLLDERAYPSVDLFDLKGTALRLQGTSVDEPAGLLSERVGHPVVERTFPGTDAVARIIHEKTVVFYERGYVVAKSWLQWQGGGIPYMVADLVHDGGYLDHRIVRDGDRYYVLVLADHEPRPSSDFRVLSMYRIDADHFTQLNLPSLFAGQGDKQFIDASGLEVLWDLSHYGKPDWRLVRLVNGVFQSERIDDATAKALMAKSK